MDCDYVPDAGVEHSEYGTHCPDSKGWFPVGPTKKVDFGTEVDVACGISCLK